MIVLTVDTATSYVSAGIVELEDSHSASENVFTVLDSEMLYEPRGHMETLVPAIHKVLSSCGKTPQDIDAIVTGVGPGPFTGLRVGMATAQAMGQALNIPVHGVGTLEAIALNDMESSPSDARTTPGSSEDAPPVLVLTDARRREWFGQAFDPQTRSPRGDATVAAPDFFYTEYSVASIISDIDVATDEWSVLSREAHPEPSGLVRAAVKDMLAQEYKIFLGTFPGPLQAEYIRRPDAIEPQKKPISSAVDFSSVHNSDSEKQRPVTGDTTPDYAVRPMRLEDIPQVLSIEQELFSAESPWSTYMFEGELRYPRSHYWVVENTSDQGAGQILGYAGIAAVGLEQEPEYEIRTMAVAEAQQGRGIGRVLMNTLLTQTDAHPGPMYLEVRTDNEPALHMYRSNGFEEAGIRKNYYQPGGFDAYTMRRAPQGVTE